MAGRPFTALMQGASMVAKQVQEQKEYQSFVTLFYDSAAKAYVCKNDRDFNLYEAELAKYKAGGSTSFVEVFKYIEKYLRSAEKLKDISVIFFTDGQDTCSDKKDIMKSMEDLQKTLKKKEITSRFLTIGFTNDHDAKFLNTIAQSGSDLGNFFYINTEKANYPD